MSTEMARNFEGERHSQHQRLVWVMEDDGNSRFVFDEILSFRYDLVFFESIEELRNALIKLQEPDSLMEVPDLVIADLRLPDGSFLNHMAELKNEGLGKIPFMVVSSLDDIDALRICFANGALDYLTKPFAKSELIVKLERLFKDEVAGTTPIRKDQPFVVDVLTSTIRRGSLNVTLTPKELQIVSLLQHRQGAQVARQEITETIWKDVTVSPKTLDVHLVSLRKKIAPLGLEIKFRHPCNYLLQIH